LRFLFTLRAARLFVLAGAVTLNFSLGTFNEPLSFSS
jgi:hypothetical protein